MFVISLKLLLVVVTAAFPLTSITCVLIVKVVSFSKKEVYCHQHSLLGDEEERVEKKEMCVDQCVLIHTDHKRPRRKILKIVPPNTFRIKIGE